MFICKQCADSSNAGHSKLAQAECRNEGDEQQQHGQVKTASDPKRARDAKVARNGVQARLAVKIAILARIENIEAANPKGDRGGKQENAGIQRAADGDPSRRG